MQTVCRICGNAAANRIYAAQEMMFATHAAFDYFQCASCGCLQIAESPKDIGRYYPDSYYSYAPSNRGDDNPLSRYLKKQRMGHFLGRRSALGALLTAHYGAPEEAWLRPLGFDFDTSFLDVGCGSGMVLLDLRRHGFKNLVGADPFIDHDIDYANGVRILKRRLSDVTERFDVIMMHHSLEHMPDQIDALHNAADRLNPGGRILVRIPLVSCEAWDTYGLNWVQLGMH
jgi:SAM-dependent methyltransferase